MLPSTFLTLAQEEGLLGNLPATELPLVDMTVPPPWATRSAEVQSNEKEERLGLPAAIIGVLRQVHPDTQMSPAAWHQLVQLVTHLIWRVGFAAGVVAAAAAAAPPAAAAAPPPAEAGAAAGERPLQVDSDAVAECVVLVLPGELKKHGASEIKKQMAQYAKTHMEEDDTKEEGGTKGGTTPLTIKIKTMHGSTITLEVDAADTIKVVKDKLHSTEGFKQHPPEKQKLIFAGKSDNSVISP